MIFRLTILGSNSAIPVRDRLPTSQFLQAGNESFLIDCGEGTQLQLRKYRLSMQRISRIFVSHLHGDHFFGLVGLISTNNLLGRKKELHIHGDARLEEIVRMQLDVSLTTLNFPLHFHPLEEGEDGVIYEGKYIRVEAFPLEHSVPTHGFLFREIQAPPKILANKLRHTEVPDEAWERIRNGEDFIDDKGRKFTSDDLLRPSPPPRAYAFVSDTQFMEGLAARLKGVDLMYHEATFMKDLAGTAKEKLHSTAEEAAMVAKAAGAAELIIGHFSARYKDVTPVVEEAQEIFSDTRAALEGDVFDIEMKKK